MSTTTNTPEAVADRARGILTAWAVDDPSAMVGWAAMSVVELHDVCDPNAAFDAAASDETFTDWEAYIAVMNDAMSVYDARYTVG